MRLDSQSYEDGTEAGLVYGRIEGALVALRYGVSFHIANGIAGGLRGFQSHLLENAYLVGLDINGNCAGVFFLEGIDTERQWLDALVSLDVMISRIGIAQRRGPYCDSDPWTGDNAPATVSWRWSKRQGAWLMVS